MNIFKRAVLTALIALILPSLASATMVLKLATSVPDGTSWMKALREAGKRVENQTDGRVKLKFYPGGVMGTDATVLRKMRVGQIHGAAFTGGELFSITKDAQIYTLPFLFKSQSDVDLVRPVIDPLLRQSIEDKGYKVLGMSGGGFAYLMSNETVLSLEKLRSKKVWVPMGDTINNSVLNQLQISPISLSMSDVYTGLQTGLIDTAATTAVGALAFQWFTKFKAVVDEPISYVMGFLIVDQRFLKRISESDMKVLTSEMDTTFEYLDRVNRKDETEARKVLENRGLEFSRMPIEQREIFHQQVKAALESEDVKKQYSEPLYQKIKDLMNQAKQGS